MKTAIKWIVQTERAIIFICSLIISFTFCFVVLLRYGFESDLFAFEEWVLTIAFILYFIGGAAATADNVHIKADIVLELLKSEKTKAGFQSFVMVLETLIGVMLTYYAVLMVMNEFVRWPNIPTTTVHKIPLALPRIFILTGFALMTLHSALHAVRFFTLYRNPDTATQPSLQED